MTKTIVHVNQHIIKANKKNGTDDPPLTIRRGKLKFNVSECTLRGPVVVVYRPDKPLSCGARVWIECGGVETFVSTGPVEDWEKIANGWSMSS